MVGVAFSGFDGTLAIDGFFEPAAFGSAVLSISQSSLSISSQASSISPLFNESSKDNLEVAALSSVFSPVDFGMGDWNLRSGEVIPDVAVGESRELDLILVSGPLLGAKPPLAVGSICP